MRTALVDVAFGPASYRARSTDGVTSEVVAELAERWDADPRTISCVSRGGNLVYRFESGAGRFYLRVSAHGVHPLELVAAAVGWHRYLHDAGAPVAEPVRSADGFWVEVIAGTRMPTVATVTREARGAHVHFSNPSEVAAWGDAIGRIHAVSEDYQTSSVSTRAGIVEGTLPALLQLFEQIEPAVTGDPLLQLHYDRGLQWIRTQPRRTVVTHSDVRPGNALISDSRVTMIDFDEPTHAWPAYDLGRMMMDDEARLPANPAQHLNTILDGYRRARPQITIAAEDVWQFLRIRALLMYVWSQDDATTDAAWRERLRAVLE
jgi:Ser/Thr protein kinase RdoA (MazF antagonist)